MKRPALALLLILLMSISAAEVVGDVSSVSSPVWVEVERFSGGFMSIDGPPGHGSASGITTPPFRVSHSEFRFNWSINPDEVPPDWYGSGFDFYVFQSSTREYLGGVSDYLYSSIKNGTVIVQTSKYRAFHIEFGVPPLSRWELIIEENVNSPLLDIVPPTVSILSPKNITYETENVTVTFSVNEPTDYINCFLDGELVGGSRNGTLTGLSEGTHNFVVHAVDEVGNKMDETVIFSIDVPEPPSLFSTAWIVTAVVILIVTGVALLIYFKKRKH